MHRYRLPRDYRKWNTKPLVCGERAITSVIRMPGHSANGLVARVTMLRPGRAQEPIEVMYHRTRLARKLFPNNFLRVVGTAPANGVMHGPVLLSKQVKLDALSNKVLRIFYGSENSISAMQKKVRHADYVRHAKRVEEIAKPIARKMCEQGIRVNTNPANVWFTTKGTPIFFDIKDLDLNKVSLKIGRRAAQESVKYLTEHPQSEQTWY